MARRLPHAFCALQGRRAQRWQRLVHTDDVQDARETGEQARKDGDGGGGRLMGSERPSNRKGERKVGTGVRHLRRSTARSQCELLVDVRCVAESRVVQAARVRAGCPFVLALCVLRVSAVVAGCACACV